MHRPVHWQFLQEKNTNAPTSALAVPTGEKHQCTDQRMFLQEKKDQFGSPTGQVSSTSCWTRPGKSIREAEKSLLVDAFEKVDDLVVPVKQIHGCLPFFFPREEFLMEKTSTDVNPNHPVCREKARITRGGRIPRSAMRFWKMELP
jgi:hypothetical protein